MNFTIIDLGVSKKPEIQNIYIRVFQAVTQKLYKLLFEKLEEFQTKFEPRNSYKIVLIKRK